MPAPPLLNSGHNSAGTTNLWAKVHEKCTQSTHQTKCLRHQIHFLYTSFFSLHPRDWGLHPRNPPHASTCMVQLLLRSKEKGHSLGGHGLSLQNKKPNLPFQIYQTKREHNTSSLNWKQTENLKYLKKTMSSVYTIYAPRQSIFVPIHDSYSIF